MTDGVREDVGGYREEGAAVGGGLACKAQVSRLFEYARKDSRAAGEDRSILTLAVARFEIEVPLIIGRARDDIALGGGMIDLLVTPIGSAALSTNVFRFGSGCVATRDQRVSSRSMAGDKSRQRGAYRFLRMRASFPGGEPWSELAHCSASRSSPSDPL